MLSHFVIKFESFDVDGFTNSVRQFSSRGVIVIWNYNGEIRIVQCPENLPLKRRYTYFKPGSWNERRWIKWPALIGWMTWILFNTLRREKIKHFHVGGGDVLLWIGQFAKCMGRIERTSTTMEDWSAPRPYKSFFTWLNGTKAQLNDFLLMRMDTTVIVTPKEIFAARNAYWNGKTLKNSVLYDHAWAWFLERKALPKSPNAMAEKYICLLGTMRKEFGIEIIFKLLPELNRSLGIRLKIIGPVFSPNKEFQQLAQELGVNQYIDWRGFVPTDELPRELAGCFCGINIQEKAQNDSRLVIAGRVVHYLQHFLVPVVSLYSGALVQFIEREGMGVICQPSSDAIKAAIIEAYHQQAKFQERIDQFLVNNPYRLQADKIFGL